MNTFRIAIVNVITALFLRCALSPFGAGTGQEGEARTITGHIVDSTGQPAPNTLVMALPADFNRLESRPISQKQTDTTDADGNYRIILPDSGTYTIQASSFLNQTRLLIKNLHVTRDSVTAPTAALLKPGAIRVMLPDSLDNINGYLYIPGTTLFFWLADANESVVLDSVPAGVIPSIVYKVLRSSMKKTLSTDISVLSNTTITIWPSWRCSKQLVLNTASTGAGVTGTVTNFPVLVRLTSASFAFSEARPDGGDLRFTKADGLPLAFEIEQWDSARGLAAIWVKVDTVYGNNGTQSIVMYWGNASALPVSGSTVVFDTGSGFAGVWHMDQTAGAIVRDATQDHYDGTPSSPVPAAAAGVIGGARQFNGFSNYITMPNTASGKLNFPKNGTYSLSAWVWVDTLDHNGHMILSKGWYQYFIHIGAGLNAFEFNEYVDKTGYDRTGMPAIPREWHYMTGVRSGTSEYLYIDGVCVDSTIEMIFFDTQPWTTTGDLSIGRNPAEPWSFFKGKIDEARIMNRVPGADWVRLCYMNQRADDKLVQCK